MRRLGDAVDGLPCSGHHQRLELRWLTDTSGVNRPYRACAQPGHEELLEFPRFGGHG